MPKEKDDTYVLISGKGRSGSNRLLDILDTSRRTVCRSEPNEIKASMFSGIGGELFVEDFGPDALNSLETALAGAATRRSARDRVNQTDKAYLTALGRAALPSLGKARFRRALTAMKILESEGEWRLPAAFMRRERSSDVLPVLKLNSTPAWAVALAKADERALILHNIRDPFDYLQSWYNRFIISKSGTKSFEKNFQDVPKLLAFFDRTGAERLREPTDANLIEVELWRWRYINEVLLSLRDRRDQYLIMTYSEIEADLLGAARRVFAFAGLPFDHAEEVRIGNLSNVLFQVPHRAQLDPVSCRATMAKVLEDSPLKTLFDPV